MITFQEETLDECLAEMKPLLHEHWEEVAHHKDVRPLDPDYDRYYHMEKLDALSMVTARDDGILVGYFVCFLAPHLHYKDCFMALNDILYIAKEYRGGTMAYKLFRTAEQILAAKGVEEIHVSMKADAPFERLCESLGYNKFELVYSKRVQ